MLTFAGEIINKVTKICHTTFSSTAIIIITTVLNQ